MGPEVSMNRVSVSLLLLAATSIIVGQGRPLTTGSEEDDHLTCNTITKDGTPQVKCYDGDGNEMSNDQIVSVSDRLRNMREKMNKRFDERFGSLRSRESEESQPRTKREASLMPRFGFGSSFPSFSDRFKNRFDRMERNMGFKRLMPKFPSLLDNKDWPLPMGTSSMIRSQQTNGGGGDSPSAGKPPTNQVSTSTFTSTSTGGAQSSLNVGGDLPSASDELKPPTNEASPSSMEDGGGHTFMRTSIVKKGPKKKDEDGKGKGKGKSPPEKAKDPAADDEEDEDVFGDDDDDEGPASDSEDAEGEAPSGKTKEPASTDESEDKEEPSAPVKTEEISSVSNNGGTSISSSSTSSSGGGGSSSGLVTSSISSSGGGNSNMKSSSCQQTCTNGECKKTCVDQDGNVVKEEN